MEELFTNFSDDFLSQYKIKQPKWGFNGLGYIVYKRCVDMDTPILCADLTWKSAGLLTEGDKIIGFDEEPISKFKNKTRYLRFGEVTHNKIELADCLGIELEDGTILYATPEHSWLVKFENNSIISWRETKDLAQTKDGGNVYLLRPFGKPWFKDESFNSGYLSGVYDEEGYLDRSHGIIFTQTDNIVLENVEKCLTQKGFGFKKVKKSEFSSHIYKNPRKECFDLKTYGTKNVFRFLGQIRPERLLQKFLEICDEQTQDSLGEQMNCDPEDYVKVKRIFDAGKRQIAVLSTSLKTHFTGGFASHNTYSRKKENDSTEEWWETIQRCIVGAQKVGAQYTQNEAERLFDHVFNLRCNFAGRMLWQLGTETVERFGLPSMCNCWFTTVTKPEDFCFIFEHLMLGGGVGFSIKREHIHELSKVRHDVNIVVKDTKDADFIVPDSREGWVEIFRKVLDSIFVSGKSFSYSTLLVRGYGEKINGFGGTASGPKYLIEMIDTVLSIAKKRIGKKLRSIDVLDICNAIASCVVSGNVRRSSEIAIGDPDDYLFLRAKNWSLGNVPNWRAMSNNSIYADSYTHISDEIWKNGYEIDKTTGKAKGEPYGFVNIDLCRTKGRLKDEDKKDNCEGVNPCAEATLESKEPCDLAEIYLNNIESVEQLIDCCQLLYKIQKAILMLPSISPETVEVVRRNMRIGLGVTGICQSLNKIEWLSTAYEKLREFDKKCSKERGWNESIKLTVVKPSGTLSLLAGASPGVHPGYSKYFIRRVRMSSSDPLIQFCRDLNYHVEYVLNFDGSENRDTMLVEFPCCFDEETILAKDMTAVKQLDLVKSLQTNWADQAVSVTVYYKLEELPEIKEWLKNNYEDSIKTVSFLLHSEHGFQQAPFEEISEEDYYKMLKKVKPLITAENINGEILDTGECASGACPVR